LIPAKILILAESLVSPSIVWVVLPNIVSSSIPILSEVLIATNVSADFLISGRICNR